MTKPIPRFVRQTVLARDGDRCCSCGWPQQLELNHRINKGMGGSNLLDYISNLVTMCHGCNNALEADASFRDSGLRMGWKVQSWDDPHRIPVYFQYAREWRLLNDKGTYVVVDEEQISLTAGGVPLVDEGLVQ